MADAGAAERVGFCGRCHKTKPLWKKSRCLGCKLRDDETRDAKRLAAGRAHPRVAYGERFYSAALFLASPAVRGHLPYRKKTVQREYLREKGELPGWLDRNKDLSSHTVYYGCRTRDCAWSARVSRAVGDDEGLYARVLQDPGSCCRVARLAPPRLPGAALPRENEFDVAGDLSETLLAEPTVVATLAAGYPVLGFLHTGWRWGSARVPVFNVALTCHLGDDGRGPSLGDLGQWSVDYQRRAVGLIVALPRSPLEPTDADLCHLRLVTGADLRTPLLVLVAPDTQLWRFFILTEEGTAYFRQCPCNTWRDDPAPGGAPHHHPARPADAPPLCTEAVSVVVADSLRTRIGDAQQKRADEPDGEDE
jgi:hypothetical protein